MTARYFRQPVHLDEVLSGVRHIWLCEPPSLLWTYRVTRDEIVDDVRYVYSWERVS